MELVSRIEEQQRVLIMSRRQRRRVGGGACTARVRALAREGALSKAIAALTTEVAPLDSEEQLRWAKELLPRAADPEQACAGHEDGLEGDPQPKQWRSCMAGVRFGALSAPGPTGTRPEHLREVLAVRRAQWLVVS